MSVSFANPPPCYFDCGFGVVGITLSKPPKWPNNGCEMSPIWSESTPWRQTFIDTPLSPDQEGRPVDIIEVRFFKACYLPQIPCLLFWYSTHRPQSTASACDQIQGLTLALSQVIAHWWKCWLNIMLSWYSCWVEVKVQRNCETRVQSTILTKTNSKTVLQRITLNKIWRK